jgi:hypothetical protein
MIPLVETEQLLIAASARSLQRKPLMIRQSSNAQAIHAERKPPRLAAGAA